MFVDVMYAYRYFYLLLWYCSLLLWFGNVYRCQCSAPVPPVVSNSGPVLSSVINRLSAISRHKRASYIDSEPRLSESLPFNAAQAQALVDEHNRYRRVVPATNMQMLKWDPYLASQAQAHASTCTFAHSQNRVNAGENIYVAYGGDNYLQAIKLWFDEVYDKECACPNYFKECCGHYTQVVWADSNRVGCGFAHCKSVLYAPWQRYALVCQYSPQGNLLLANEGEFYPLPAFTYRRANDQPCSQCPAGSTCNNGLCDTV